MDFPARPRFSLPSLGLAIAALASGCASPGPPRPPSLQLPEQVTNLSAQRIGDAVELRWTSPASTTDGIPIKGSLTAVICREDAPQPSNSAQGPGPACPETSRLATKPGPAVFADPLSPDLLRDPVRPLTYHVSILNAAGHSAGLSNPAATVAGQAPAAIGNLRLSATRDGALIQWQPESSNTASTLTVDLVRTAPIAATIAKPKAGLHLSGEPATSASPIHFSTGPVAADPGGTLDRTARRGETYTYTAQRIRLAALTDPETHHRLDLRSVFSPPATVLVRDVFPPATPAGLAAVAFDAASAPVIDLSWEPVPDSDAMGYLVYRRDLTAGGASIRITAAPTIGPAFRDLAVLRDHAYAYAVTAVDAAGNESPPSNEVQETVPSAYPQNQKQP